MCGKETGRQGAFYEYLTYNDILTFKIFSVTSSLFFLDIFLDYFLSNLKTLLVDSWSFMKRLSIFR
jgi:hypothetical protein